MQAMAYDGSQDVATWLMSEKLEGVGGYWDGERLVSRNGEPFSPPPEFTFDLPDFPLEGVIGNLGRAGRPCQDCIHYKERRERRLAESAICRPRRSLQSGRLHRTAAAAAGLVY